MAVSVAGGVYHFGWVDMPSMVRFNAQNPASPLIAVYVSFDQTPLAVITRKDAGIRKPADLDGKKIAGGRGTPVFLRIAQGRDHSCIRRLHRVAETVAANKGIGNLMLVASSRFEVPLAFAGLLVTAVMGIGMYVVAEYVERRMTGWAMRGADSGMAVSS